MSENKHDDSAPLRPRYPEGGEQPVFRRVTESRAPDQVYQPPAQPQRAPAWAQGGAPRRSRHTVLWALAALLAFAALCLMGFYAVSLYQAYPLFRQKAAILARNTFAPGIYVDHVSIGGMTRQEAEAALKSQSQQSDNSLWIRLHVDGLDWTITPGPGVTASVTSGNGNADITLAFAANTGSTAATYTATVSAAGCDDVTITITQQGAGGSSGVKDTITSALLTATSTTYTDFSNVAATSQARYAGNSAKSSSGGIQLRSKNSNSGIVSTVSGGRVKSVTITVESGSNVIDVYGSNTAYTGAGDLYATGEGANQGTKIGSLSETGTITFTGNYSYVGIRSNNGAVYVTSVEIVWE